MRGIDFTNDPLLQGRNFSYLDTQLKRLGSPNFVHLPINAPQCPVHNFQQDGHMATRNPKGRVNYEPNSWGIGPRESAAKGFHSVAVEENGAKTRTRSEKFADHYSQARQFYISQTPVEQQHIINALTFELSKVERVDIRERMVSHLLNIDENMAKSVAARLGLQKMPEPIHAARTPKMDLPASPALSILRNGPKSFKGRSLGILVSDGIDATQLASLRDAMKAEGAMVKIVAPRIGGVKTSNGQHIPADERIDGGPSVLFDAVAVIVHKDKLSELMAEPSARDFVSDAIAHGKFIAHNEDAMSLLDTAHLDDAKRKQLVALEGQGSLKNFVEKCRSLRIWAMDVEKQEP